MKSFIEDSYVHPDALKKSKINVEANLQLKINKKSQLLFRGSLLGHLRKEKKAINQGEIVGSKIWFIFCFSRQLYFSVMFYEFTVRRCLQS